MGQGCVLRPSEILQKFKARIVQILSTQCDITVDSPVVKIVGPAVNFCLKYSSSIPRKVAEHNMFTTKQFSKDKNSIIVSVDLTLAIEIEKGISEEWPLQDVCDACHGLHITDVIRMLCRKLGIKVNSCHLIAKGGYWNVSFANIEGEIMQHLPDSKACLRAIKVGTIIVTAIVKLTLETL